MFIKLLFVIAQSWEQPKCTPIAEWITGCDIAIEWNTTEQ